MSFENKNLYALLGNDVEDESALPPQTPREVVKNTTSSKKSDVPPAKADPTRAKKNKKGPTGNEAALKNKTNNKDVAPPSNTASHKEKKPFDRHSRTGKTDSKKKFKQGWGSDDKRELDDETNATGDALVDLEKDAAEKGEPAPPAAKSLQDYLSELQLAENNLDGKRTVRSANQGAEEKWAQGEVVEKHTEDFVKATHARKQKQKASKEKKFLDFTAMFPDEAPRPQADSTRGGFKGSRGPKPTRGGKGGNAKKAQPPVVNDKNFPSLK